MNSISTSSILVSLLVLTCSVSISAEKIPAFPGAEGAGMWSKGGRGGRVIVVTNLNDRGPGSFRDACEASGPRTVVFRVSGTINLESGILVCNPYLTIAGQTAPGDGICLKHGGLQFQTHDVIVRHLRVRPGVDRDKAQLDCINIGTTARDIIVDHCSTSWSSDEGISCNGDIDRVTVQWCIVAENLGQHGYGCILGSYAGEISYHHNLFVSNISRQPRPAGWANHPGAVRWDFRNNVVHNWGGAVGYNGNYHKESDPNRQSEVGNLIGNFYTVGPDSNATHIFRHRVKTSKMYADGNLYNGKPADWIRIVCDEGLGVRESSVRVEKPFSIGEVKTQSARGAYESVLRNVGATLPKRDPLDRRLVQEVKTRKGALVADASGLRWPRLRSIPAPIDVEQDGLPDDWERHFGLNTNTDDAQHDNDGDGYTNLEEYLNDTSPNE